MQSIAHFDHQVFRRVRATLAPALTLALLSASVAVAQEQRETYVSPPVHPYLFRGDLHKLPPSPPLNLPPVPLRLNPSFPLAPPLPIGLPDPVWQKALRTKNQKNQKSSSAPGGDPSQFTTPNPNFDTNQPGDGPPDANGAVGPNHYIAIVNFTFQIFDKSGNSLAGPTNPATFWSTAPAGDPCRSQRGDPYVLYDHLADRWVITYFANNPAIPGDSLQYQCIAVSKGPNPVTDGFFAYTFFLGISNDYPKLSIWPDGYYMISQEGYDGTSSLDAWVFDRANMLNGNPATFQHPSGFPSEHDVIALPSDLTGALPPTGSPNFYARPYDGNLYSDGSPRLEIFEFHVDWGVPSNTTFSLVQTLTPATFSSSICSGASLNQYCVPQPGTSATLDALSIWPMGPLQYRNFGDHETLVFDHAVNADGAGLVGMRWYELRRTPPGSGSWVIEQQSTFAPADSTTTTTASIDRWTGSVSMDQAGNMAMGYNVSNDGVSPHPTVFPGMRVVGRLSTDPPGEMTTQEVHLVDGGGVNGTSGGQRWGDYSAMRVDPADACTFWYTTEYVAAAGQRTHVGALRFATCNPADLSVTKTGPATATAGTQISYTITVTNNGPSNATNVIVTDTLPAGVIFQSTSAVCNSGDVLTGCNLGSLADGANNTFTIQVLVSANFLSSIGASTSNITNSVSVTSDQFDPNTSNNTATATTNVIQSADVQITKICKPDSPAPAGSSGFCTLTVSNNGPSDAQNVVVTDTLTDANPFEVTSIIGAACVPSSSGFVTSFTTSCSLGTLAASASTSFVVNVTANVGGNINDLATVSSSTPDPNTSNNQATGTVTFFSSADLSITKTSSPNPVVAGTNLTYTINVGNAGPSPATNVVVKDTLPGQVSVVGITPSQGSCTPGIPGNPAQPMTCTLGTVASSGSATISVVVTVASNTPAGTTLVNNATVTSDVSDPNNGNNSATAYTSVSTSADVAIVKTSDKLVYKPTSIITYTITVTNNGPSDSLAVVVTDNLPLLKQAIYKSDTGGCTKNATPPTVLKCSLGTMPSGTSKSFNIYELVKGSKGSVVNTATVASTGPNPTPDPNSANNTSINTVTIGH